MRNCQPGAYYAGAGRRVAEADLRHILVSDHPTTDIRETCTLSRAVGRAIAAHLCYLSCALRYWVLLLDGTKR